MLASLILAGHYDSRRDMSYSDGRIGLVYMLTAGTAAPVGVNPQILRVYFNIYLII